MAQKKGGLKRAERRQPEPLPLHTKTGENTEKPTFNPHLHDQSNVSSVKASSKATRKRGQSSKSLARAKLEKGVEKADRLKTKASKRMHQIEKRKRAKESA